MPIGEHFANRIVGLEQRFVAHFVGANDGEFAGPGELRVVRIDFEFRRRRDNAGLFAHRRVAPIVFRREIERGPHQFVAHRDRIRFNCSRCGDADVVPVVDAVGVEVRLADFRPVLGLIAAGVGELPEPLLTAF